MSAASPICSYSYISGTSITQIASGAVVLHTIVVGETAPGAITIYDESALSGTNTIAGVLKASVVEGTYIFDSALSKGLRVVVAAGSKITVNYT